MDLRTPAERQWYAERNCTHVHCSAGCEHPQERMLSDGRMVCGRCLILDGLITLVSPCVPGVCDD